MCKTKRYSVAKKRIQGLCRLVGVNYTEKTCINFRHIAEAYVRMRQNMDYLIGKKLPRNIEMSNEAGKLFEAMIDKEVLSDDKIGELVIRLYSMMDVELMIKRTLAMVKSFEINGDLYHKILYNRYFADTMLSDEKVREMTNYSYGHYHTRKKEAIMLFGVTFWSQIVDQWDNSVDEMKEIEDRNGRDNSLSSARADVLKSISAEGLA